MPKIQLFLWSSSHGTPQHFLPEKLSEELDDHPFFNNPIVYAESGASINNDIVNLIQTEIATRSESPQLHCIILGSNNIRSLRENPHYTAHFFEDILRYSTRFRDCHIVLSSVIPSPCSDAFTNGAFAELSAYLNDITAMFPNNSSYYDIASLLCRNGYPDLRNYDQRDYLHLSRRGATAVASGLKVHLRTVFNNFFR